MTSRSGGVTARDAVSKSCRYRYGPRAPGARSRAPEVYGGRVPEALVEHTPEKKQALIIRRRADPIDVCVLLSPSLALVELSLHHHPHHIGHGVARFPSQLSIRFPCIALAAHDVGWPLQLVV